MLILDLFLFNLVGVAQVNNFWHMRYGFADLCPTAVEVLPQLSCPKGQYYFGRPNVNCLDENFSCASSLKATTQFWFLHKIE